MTTIKSKSTNFKSIPISSDWVLIGIYWALAAPLIFYSNFDTHGYLVTFKALLFTIILDTSTVLLMLFFLPNDFLKGRYLNASIMGFILLMVLSYIYSWGYHYLFGDPFRTGVFGLLSNMIEHARSYGILVVLISAKKFHDVKIEFERMERFKIEDELKFIRNQINPHFLFNTLNNVYALVENKNPIASKVINRLSDLLRYVIYDANKEWVRLKDELKFIEDFFNLERLRHDNLSNLSLVITGDPGQLIIAPSILVLFIENGFKHGLNSSINNWIKIEILIQENVLQLMVENPKSSHGVKRSSGGLGLNTARRHLELQYPDKHQLDINDDGKRYTVNLILELHEQ